MSLCPCRDDTSYVTIVTICLNERYFSYRLESKKEQTMNFKNHVTRLSQYKSALQRMEKNEVERTHAPIKANISEK